MSSRVSFVRGENEATLALPSERFRDLLKMTQRQGWGRSERDTEQEVRPGHRIPRVLKLSKRSSTKDTHTDQ